MSYYPDPQPRPLPAPIPSLAAHDIFTITDRLRHRAESKPDGVYFHAPRRTSSSPSYDVITNADVWERTRSFARHLVTLLPPITDLSSAHHQPCIALVGKGNTLEYFLTLQAMIAVNLKVLLLSDRNAQDDNDVLLRGAARAGWLVAIVEKGCERAIVGGDDDDGEDVRPTIIEMPSDYRAIPPTRDVGSLTPFWNDPSDASSSSTTPGYGRGSYVLHTSGTTGRPQPVTMTHGQALAICHAYNRSLDYLTPSGDEEELLAPLLFPMYHAAALNILGSRLSLILPDAARWPPSPRDLVESWQRVGRSPDVLPTPSSLLADLVALVPPESSSSVWSGIHEVCPTGSLAAPDVIAQLTRANIVTRSTYGSSEGGLMLQTPGATPENPLPQWDGWRLIDLPGIRMVDVGTPTTSDERACEIIVDHRWPCASDLWSPPTCHRAAVSANEFRVGDLFVERPPGSGLFFIQGRLDDMIVHSSGEKTNAIEVAAAIMAAPSAAGTLAAACALGMNRPCPCVLVAPLASDASVSPADLARDPRWQKTALAAVREANARLARYSRIPEELVLAVASLPLTPKGSIRRNQAEQDHREEIDKLYRDYERGVEVAASRKSNGDGLPSVLACVQVVLPHITDDEQWRDKSLFDQGLDSISVHRLRNACNRYLAAADGGEVTTLDVYDARTLRRLEELVERRRKGGGDDSRDRKELEWMVEKVRRGRTRGQDSTPTTAASSPPVVLITGATGSLGGAIVTELLESDSDVRVLALIRAKNDEEANRRVLDALPSEERLTAIAYDPDADGGDISDVLDRPELTTVTSVLAIGWHVHFLHSLAAFEPQIEAVLALQRFCQQGGRSLHFVSSVSAMMSADRVVDAHERVDAARPKDASPMGYARSKWVVEALLDGCQGVHIYRVGQIVGATGAAWRNRHEASAQLVDYSAESGLWPETLEGGAVDWLPVDEVARHVVRRVRDGSTSFGVENVTHPRPIRWRQLRAAVASSIGHVLTDVPADEWLARFKQARGDALLGTLRGMLASGSAYTPMFRSALDVESVAPLSDADVRAWIDGWRDVGRLSRVDVVPVCAESV